MVWDSKALTNTVAAATLPCVTLLFAEGEFIRRTAPVALMFIILAEALGLLFTLGNVLPDHRILNVY